MICFCKGTLTGRLTGELRPLLAGGRRPSFLTPRAPPQGCLRTGQLAFPKTGDPRESRTPIWKLRCFYISRTLNLHTVPSASGHRWGRQVIQYSPYAPRRGLGSSVWMRKCQWPRERDLKTTWFITLYRWLVKSLRGCSLSVSLCSPHFHQPVDTEPCFIRVSV